MKRLCLVLLALAAVLGPNLLADRSSTHPRTENSARVALAMEPASFVLVGFGMVGAGVLRRKKILAGISLLQTQPAPASTPAKARLPHTNSSAARTRPHGRIRAAFRPTALAAVLLGTLLLAGMAHADSITFSALANGATTLSPSTDTISLNASTGTVNSGAGSFVLQTGDFKIGDSEIPDQVINFSFLDTITLNGVTQQVLLTGEDNVTTTADELILNASGPVAFGNEILTIGSVDLSGVSIGQDLAIHLQGTVAPTPEPASLILLGTGILLSALFLSRRQLSLRDLAQESSDEASGA